MIPFLIFANATLPLKIQVGNPSAPNLTAQSAIVMDATSGRVLYGLNIHASRYPASTTKIMTGLLLAEKTNPSEIITAPAEIDKIRGSSLHLKPGERLTSEDFLFGLMLRSANDGAVTVARYISGSEAEFAKLMNSRARSIGCKDTIFYTPHGLNHPYHKTTAYDLALIAQEAVKNSRFSFVISQSEHIVNRSINKLDTQLKNTNWLIKKDASIKGIKTGFTNPAGRCFVGLISDSERKIITVILKSDDWANDQIAITQWAKEEYFIQPVIPLGPASEYKVINGKKETVTARFRSNQTALLSNYDLKNATINPSQETFTAPIVESQVLAKVDLVLPDGTTFKDDLVSTNSIEAKPNLTPTGLAVLVCVSGMTYWMKSRARKKRKPRRR